MTFGTYSQCDVIFPGITNPPIQGEVFSDSVGFIHARITKDLFGMFKIERVRNSIVHLNGEELTDRSSFLRSGDVIKIHTNEFEFV